MKEIRQKYGEIGVQDDNITENATVRSPLTFRRFTVCCCLDAKPKTQRKLERHFVQVKVQQQPRSIMFIPCTSA